MLIEELYTYLKETLEITENISGNLKLEKNYINYYINNLEIDDSVFQDIYQNDKITINDVLPNGFSISYFNIENDYISFKILSNEQFW